MNTGKRIIDLSLIPDGIEPRIYVSQYDVGVTLTFNWSGTLAAGGAARVMGTKPSGIGFDLACTRVGSGTSVTGFTVETTLDMTSEAGEFPAEIRITEGTQVVGSQNFTLVVERSPHPDGTIDGYEEGRTIIETVTGLVNDAEESASEAATSATAASQSATAAAQSATSAAADAESADASAARAMATTPEGYEEFVSELLSNQNGGFLRKNLLKNTANSTGNFTVNADGTVTVNGSFTSQTNLNIGTIRFDEDTRVVLNGAPAGGGTSSYALFISGKGTDSGSGATFTLNAGVTYTVVLRLYAGYTANNLVIKPMVRPATIEDGTYVPYAPSNSALNADLANKYPISINVNGRSYSFKIPLDNRGALVFVNGDRGGNFGDLWFVIGRTDENIYTTFSARIIKITNLTDNQFLTYDASTNTFTASWATNYGAVQVALL